MIPILTLLLILGISMTVIRVAAVALEHTGLSRDAARFQARSAFTGVGFTTSEAEHVVSQPVRRRIVMWLMLVGNIGIVSAMAALLLSAIDLRSEHGVGILLAILGGGLALLWWLGASSWVDRQMCRAIRWAIGRWTDLDPRDYARLLHLRDEYSVSRLRVEEGDWLAGKTLEATRLAEEGILALGIECPGGHFLGAPPPAVQVRAGDELVLYGPAAGIAELDTRCAGPDGDRAHSAAAVERRMRTQGERERSGR